MDSLFSLPSSVYLLTRTMQLRSSMPQGFRPPNLILTSGIGVIFMLARIAALLIIAALFWKCGPTIASFILPTETSPEEPAI
jgi:hypothetical protein